MAGAFQFRCVADIARGGARCLCGEPAQGWFCGPSPCEGCLNDKLSDKPAPFFPAPAPYTASLRKVGSAGHPLAKAASTTNRRTSRRRSSRRQLLTRRAFARLGGRAWQLSQGRADITMERLRRRAPLRAPFRRSPARRRGVRPAQETFRVGGLPRRGGETAPAREV